MKIAVVKADDDCRVALTPDMISKFGDFQVSIENGAGKCAGFSDAQYKDTGALCDSYSNIVKDADIVLTIKGISTGEINELKKGAWVIGLLNSASNEKIVKEYTAGKINMFALELIPRITRAQSMDVLSSQNNLAGYRAVIDAASEFSRVFPMMMTAAGTIPATRVLVLGAGVAGLQAIATAKRLGAVVYAFDVREAAREQVESLGGKFVKVEHDEVGETSSGYAKEMSAEYKKLQQEKIASEVCKADIVICTALIPGKKAPVLITKKMVSTMKPGSVVVDLAAASGGNCEFVEYGKTVNIKGVKIIGEPILDRIATDASKMFAKNLHKIVELLTSGKQKFNTDDEIVQSALVTHTVEKK